MGNVIVKLSGVNKSFPGVKALQNVSLELKSGQVLALLGENGAGKSTLMKILSGEYEKDSGEIEIFGKKAEHLTPLKAQELGIAIIHQELNLCPHLTVSQNIFLGREKRKGIVLDNKTMDEEARKILKEMDMDLDPNTQVDRLSVSKQQMVEIAKALSENAKVLIMDEPTSALTSREIDELFKIINSLKQKGCGIIYISHRLEELENVVDRVMILRDGEYITSMDFKDTNLDEIISYMVGRQITEKFPHVKCEPGDVILKVENLCSGDNVKNVSFSLRAGEIVGIAGLVGAGRTETTRAIFGADHKDSGRIILNGEEVTINKPLDAIKNGIVLVPEDRKKDGLCTKLSIRDNIALPNLDFLSNTLGVLSEKNEDELVDKTVKDLNIKLAGTHVNAESLSGGNQQKIVVGKWLARNSKVVLFDEPTRGIDVAAKVEIYNLMNELKQKGIGVLFVSSEMPEVLGMSDRIIVMAEGKITKEFEDTNVSQDEILKYASKFDLAD